MVKIHHFLDNLNFNLTLNWSNASKKTMGQALTSRISFNLVIFNTQD
jgi:hypothetical protein